MPEQRLWSTWVRCAPFFGLACGYVIARWLLGVDHDATWIIAILVAAGSTLEAELLCIRRAQVNRAGEASIDPFDIDPREVEDPWAVLYPPGPIDVERARQIARARGWLDDDGFIWDREPTP